MKSNIFLAALSLVLTLLVFSPSEIYFSNSSEFGLKIWELLATGTALSLVVTGAIFLTLVLLVRLLPAGFSSRAAAVLMALGLAAFLQGTYLGWNFGALDGSEIDWSQPLGLKIIGMCFWLGPLVLPQVIARFRTQSFVRATCLILLATQTTLLAFQLVSRDPFVSYKDYTADRGPLMQFSQQQNAILVVMDEFQCDIMFDVLEREPELSKALAGFTFFPDTVAASKQTFPSVPAMLTGMYYDNSQTAERYIAQAFGPQSLPAQLRQNGIRSELYPAIAGTVLAAPELADNAIERSYSVRSYARVVKFGLLRAFPTWMKRQMLDLEERLRNRAQSSASENTNASVVATSGPLPPRRRHFWNMVLFREALSLASVEKQADTFKFIHLEGTHVPIRLDRNLDLIKVPYSRESFVQQATGVVRLIDRFIQRLKELGVYDKSVIIITGDHGSGRSEDMWLAPSDLSQKEFNGNKARGCPLLLAKPADAKNNELTISLAPATLTDIAPTILSELGITAERIFKPISGIPGGVAFSPAKSLFDIEENEERIRGYYAYRWARHQPLFLPPITEYIVEGDVRDDASWSTGRTFIAE